MSFNIYNLIFWGLVVCVDISRVNNLIKPTFSILISNVSLSVSRCVWESAKAKNLHKFN